MQVEWNDEFEPVEGQNIECYVTESSEKALR